MGGKPTWFVYHQEVLVFIEDFKSNIGGSKVVRSRFLNLAGNVYGVARRQKERRLLSFIVNRNALFGYKLCQLRPTMVREHARQVLVQPLETIRLERHVSLCPSNWLAE